MKFVKAQLPVGYISTGFGVTGIKFGGLSPQMLDYIVPMRWGIISVGTGNIDWENVDYNLGLYPRQKYLYNVALALGLPEVLYSKIQPQTDANYCHDRLLSVDPALYVPADLQAAADDGRLLVEGYLTDQTVTVYAGIVNDFDEVHLPSDFILPVDTTLSGSPLPTVPVGGVAVGGEFILPYQHNI